MGELRIEHDDQLSSGTCTHCGAPFESVIGVMYEDDDPIAMYRADIFEHFHREPDPRVVLSIAVGDRVQMAFSDRVGSTWEELEIVSWQLTSKEAQAGALREAFLRLADHIACQDRRLRRALAPVAPRSPGL